MAASFGTLVPAARCAPTASGRLSWLRGARGDAFRLRALGLGGLHGHGLDRRAGRLVLVLAAQLPLRAPRRVAAEHCSPAELAVDGRRRHRGAGSAGAGLARDRIEHRRQVLLQLVGMAAVRNWPPVLCATQARGLSACFALGSKPMTWMRKPGAACFSDFTVAQTLALQLSSAVGDEHDVKARGRRLLGGLDQRSRDRPAELRLEACPNRSLPGVFEEVRPAWR